MGKKGSWFSAIKRVFTHSTKDEPEKKNVSKERKKGKGILRRGETKSFLPLFREPSSIEKILGEADQLLIRPPTPLARPTLPPASSIRPVSPKVTSPKAASPPRAPSPRVASPRAVSPKAGTSSTEAISSEAAPPRSFSTEGFSPKAAPPKAFTAEAASSKAPPPKVSQSRKETRYVRRQEPTLREQQLSATKLQAAYRGYLARRSFRALKGLVRLQGLVKGQNVKRQTANAMKQMQLLVRVQTQIQSRRIHMLESQVCNKNDKEAESSTLSKWTLNQLMNEDWDDSCVTKEETEARVRKKVEAVMKRERAMAYAYSHQLWKSTPKPVQNMRFPWWWNWLERRLPQSDSSHSQAASLLTTPWDYKPSPSPSRSPHPQLHHESVTPRSSRSAMPFQAKQFETTPNRIPLGKYTKSSAANLGLKDDDSLVSCPPFSVPNYMTPTASAKAKSRANSNPKERFPGTPGSDSKRRLSFPLTPDSQSVGDFSVNSEASTLVGRRPFNRFV